MCCHGAHSNACGQPHAACRMPRGSLTAQHSKCHLRRLPCPQTMASAASLTQQQSLEPLISQHQPLQQHQCNVNTLPCITSLVAIDWASQAPDPCRCPSHQMGPKGPVPQARVFVHALSQGERSASHPTHNSDSTAIDHCDEDTA